MPIDTLIFSDLSTASDSIASAALAHSEGLVNRSLIHTWVDKIIDMSISLGTKIVIAAVVYFIGAWLIRRVIAIMSAILERHKAELSLRTFLRSLVSVILNIVLILTVISILGINTASFLALFAAGGVAIGLDLSNTLQIFANGVIILLLKPYKVGDFIAAQGESGFVSAVQITTTEITTRDHRVVIIPNGAMLSGVIQNYSRLDTRRVDFSFSISYGDDIDKARETVLAICSEDARILPDPAPFVAVGELSNSSVDLTVRVFVKSDDYWDVFFEMNEKIYKEFPKHGLTVPFPQMDVHVKK